MVILTESEYRSKLQGAWLGKFLGQAAGAPMDGQRRAVETVDYPAGLGPVEPEACEGLAIQQVWLEEVISGGPEIGSDDLVRAWLERVRVTEWEYGCASANLRNDLLPPVSGAYNNPFRECLGAIARADLWGLLAAGDPATAGRYAARDGTLDHAGMGVVSAVLVAGMVSAAFAETTPTRVVEAALRLAPRESKAASAVRDVARWHGELANWRRTREMLLRSYGAEEVRDSTVAMGLIALALLDGEGDLARSLITAARCGWSAACVAAAVGAIVGAMHGGEMIPPGWQAALGDRAAREAQRLADLTFQAGRAVIAAECDGRAQVSDEPPPEESRLVASEAGTLLRDMAMGPYVICFERGPLEVWVDYDLTPTIGYDQPRRLAIGLASKANRTIEVRARVAAPEGFVAVATGEAITLAEGGTVSFSLSVSAPEESCELAPVNPCVLFLSVEEEAEVATPITLLGESVWFAAGPFAGFDERHWPEGPELRSGRRQLGGEGWHRLSVAEPAVNLLAGMEGEQGVYYLATDYQLPAETRLRLRVGCNDGTRVWLNGEEVHSQHEHRPADPRVSADEFPVGLAAGWNRLTIKMAQCSPRRFLSVALKDLEGRIMMEAVNTRAR